MGKTNSRFDDLNRDEKEEVYRLDLGEPQEGEKVPTIVRGILKAKIQPEDLEKSIASAYRIKKGARTQLGTGRNHVVVELHEGIYYRQEKIIIMISVP